MAIFSFRPAPGAHRRSTSADPPADWAETRPSAFPDADGPAPLRAGAFRTDPERSVPQVRANASAPARPAADRPGKSPEPPPEIAAAFGGLGEPAPDPGFAKALTARAQSDDLLGAGWYISSWDLMQGCDVIEGTPIDQLPPEWQRKRPRL